MDYRSPKSRDRDPCRSRISRHWLFKSNLTLCVVCRLTSGAFTIDSSTTTLKRNLTERPILFFMKEQILGDSKWLWISMATMFENLCGNCLGGVELTFISHFISVHLIFFIP
jgi:hypothetical protein